MSSGEDFIQRWEKGERYTAEDANLRGDLHKRERFGQSSAIDVLGAYHRKAEDTRRLVRLFNNTGAERYRYEVAGIDDSMYDPTSALDDFKYEVGLKGITPAVPTHNGKFGVFQEGVADGQIETAAVSGVTQVQVDILDTNDKFCDVKNGVCTELISNSTGGATILWQPGTTGVQWCIIRIGIQQLQGAIITVAKDGGSAGAPDPGGSNCSWTYTLTSLSGTELATTVAPQQARYPKTIYLEAGAGGRSAYGVAYDLTGTWLLLYLPGEIADTTVCA